MGENTCLSTLVTWREEVVCSWRRGVDNRGNGGGGKSLVFLKEKNVNN